MKAIIVDDEFNSRQSLGHMLRQYVDDVTEVGQASSVEKALEVIGSCRPDLVFLDVEMSDGTGFDVLHAMDDIQFDVIFTTAYDQYAIQAFKVNAVDYLLKPIDIDELVSAVGKCRQRQVSGVSSKQNMQDLLDHVKVGKENKIVISNTEGIHFIQLDQLIRITGSGSYSLFYLDDGRKLLSSKNLKAYAPLEAHGFFRCHKSHMINLSAVQALQNVDGGYVLMKDGSQVEISRRRKDDFLEHMTERLA